MSKAKLHEYCQKYRLQNPQYFTTNVPPLFTSIVILGLGLSKPHEFLSKESHSTKKKAENDAAEVAMDAIEKFDGDMFDNPALVKTALRTDDLVSSIWKAVEASNSGIFSDKLWVPVEYLLLFTGVRSALNRIDLKYKWDTASAFSCLLEALFTPKQNFLRVQTKDNRVLLCKIVEFTVPTAEESQQVLKPNRVSYDHTIATSFVVLPASDSGAPYEVNITFAPESNDEGSSDAKRLLNIFDRMSAQLNMAGNFAISRPLFIAAEQRVDGKLLLTSQSETLSCPENLEVRLSAQKANIVQPRLFIQHQDMTDGNKNMKENAVLNKVASWISSYPVYGDAIIASMDMTSTTAATLEHLKAVLHSSLPTGLWTASNAEKSLLSLPSWYYPTVWDGCHKDSIAAKRPSHILQEILSRRSEATGFSKLEVPCASQSDHDDDRSSASLVYEDVPLNGWWSKGVEVLHVDSSKRATNNPEIKKVHVSKGDLIKLQITLPHSEGLFSTSGRIFSSSEEVEKGSAEASEISQGLCLDALLALQSCGMEHLNHLPSYLRPYLGSVSEEAISSALPPSSSSSILQPSTPFVQSNELGEDTNEDGTEASGEGGNKKGKVLLIKFKVTPLNTRDSTSKRKNYFQDSQMMEFDRNDSMAVTDTSLTPGVESSQESTHTDEERSPKKIRYETISGASDGRGVVEPMTPSTISANLNPVETVDSTAEYQETVVTDRKRMVAVNVGDGLRGPGYTMSAFSGMGMLPKGLELELSTRPLGEIFTMSFPGDMGSCLSGRPSSGIPPSSSSSSSSVLRTPTAAGSDVVAVAAMDNGHMSSSSSSSSTVREVHVTDSSYEIKILERRIHDSQPINKKAKPNLFYPSLSTQRRRLLAAFLRAGKVSTWLDIGCGTCVVMESLLHSNITSSASSPSALALVHTPAMECVSEKSMVLTTTDSGHSIKSSSSSSSSHVDTNDTTTSATGSNSTTSSSSSSKSVSHNAPADLDMRVPTLKHITGLEYNIDPLKVAKKRLLVKIPRKEEMDSDLTSFSLWHGSILDEGVERDMQAQNEKESGTSSTESTSNCFQSSSRIRSRYQAISCIEVIEHLPSEQDAAYALQKVLCDFQPEYALFSTPNYESNGSIRTAASIKPRKKSLTTDEAESSVVESLKKADALIEADAPETFREADHKFEFTRQQFRDWAYAGLKASNGRYEVQFTEVGSGLLGMGGSEKCPIQGLKQITGDSIHRGGILHGRYTDEDGTLKRSRDRGCGGASQVAIFRRLKSNQDEENVTGAADTFAPNGSMSESGSGSGSGDKPATLFWSWNKNASTDEDQGDSV